MKSIVPRTISPQPATGSRRVQADAQAGTKRKRDATEPSDFVSRLLKRQLGAVSRHETRRRRFIDSTHVFQNIQLQGEYDGFDAQRRTVLPLQAGRSKISEVVAADGLVIALSHNGACSAFDRVSNKRLCHLNVRSDEVIRSLFWNKLSRCLVTVSVHQADNYSSLMCRSTPAGYIRQGRPGDGSRVLFDAAALRWPGFVEFDDVNGKILTYDASARVYTVYELKDYCHLYTIDDDAVREVKISPGIILMVLECAASERPDHLRMRVHSIEDGSVLQELRHTLVPGHKPEFIEVFNQALIIKQEGQPLQIRDIGRPEEAALTAPDFATPSAFIFLYERNLFLSLLDHTVTVWNFKGQQVTRFEDHLLLPSNHHVSTVYINSAQDLILSWCKHVESTDGDTGANPCKGSINLSDLHSGRLIAKVAPPSAPCTAADFARAAALHELTALVLDEEHSEIYTGNADGRVHRWCS